MAEEKTDGVKSVVSGWIKTLLTSVFGLLTGAVIMYLTPLVNSAIKPAKPVANFASQIDGLTVNFNNRSTGGVQGWWDFGDGTALEPFDPKVDVVKHTYARAGAYSVKLALQNLLGEENDRTAQVTLDPSAAAYPEIVSFDLKPLNPEQRVPAVYRLLGKVKAATHCILSLGDERPTEILDAANLERYITFSEMGNYTVRLTAVNGKQVAEKMETVFVSPNDSTNPMAKLLVTYQAVHVERLAPYIAPIAFEWPQNAQDAVVPLRKERTVDGKTIVSAELVNPPDNDSPVRHVKVAIAPDKKRIIVTGDMLKPSGAPGTLSPRWVARVKLVTERRSLPQTITGGEVMMTLNFNSPTKIPMQPIAEGYEVIKKLAKLELWDGGRKIWEGDKAVTAAPMMIKNQSCLVTAVPQADGFIVRIDGPSVTSAPPPSNSPIGPIRKVGFEFNPLLKTKSK